MSEKIRVVQYGLGPIGCKIIRYLKERPQFDIVGAIDSDPQKAGLDIGELAQLDSPLGLTVSDDAEKLLREAEADIAVLTTTSSLEVILPQVVEIISQGINVVSTCEELMYPWISNSGVAGEIDLAARENNVSVLSTGVNPGFLMDFLPLVMTGICRDVQKVTVERIQNAEFRRVPFQKKIGAGLSPQQFEHRVKEGNLRHVGLTESMHLVAAGLGWQLDQTEDVVNPVITNEPVVGLDIEAGRALGVDQTGHGYVEGKEVITLIFRAAMGEPNPRDRILIEGDPNIDVTIKNGVNGDTATCAIVVNAIPVVMRATPGLRTMADIGPISFFR
jgi:4-hydroxy-tetrahydrodipicolinate reductase